MKILVLNWQDIRNPLGGGAEVHLHEIFTRIARQGHEVTLFCSSFPGASAEEEVDGLRVIREGHRHLFNFIVPLRYRSRFRAEGYDVVVDDINKIPFYTPLYVREPIVGIVHHFFGTTIFRETHPAAAFYVYGAELLARPVYRKTWMAVVSESTREELVRYGFSEERVAIVPNSVDRTVYRPLNAERPASPVVGHVGRLKKYKSVEHLVDAMVYVRRQIPDAKLVVVGDGGHRPRLEAYARERLPAGSFTFSGHVTQGEKVRLLNGMTVAVNCSVKEGWGLTVLEANACGVPVIASDVPGLRDAVRHEETGLLYPYGNVGQLAQSIVRVLRDEQLRDRLAKAALRWASSFQWDESAKKMMGVLERVVGKPQPSF